jgi:hypothetical protein
MPRKVLVLYRERSGEENVEELRTLERRSVFDTALRLPARELGRRRFARYACMWGICHLGNSHSDNRECSAAKRRGTMRVQSGMAGEASRSIVARRLLRLIPMSGRVKGVLLTFDNKSGRLV